MTYNHLINLVFRTVAQQFHHPMDVRGKSAVCGTVIDFARLLVPGGIEGLELLFETVGPGPTDMMIPSNYCFGGLMLPVREVQYDQHSQLASGLIVPTNFAEASGLPYSPVKSSTILMVEPFDFFKREFERHETVPSKDITLP